MSVKLSGDGHAEGDPSNEGEGSLCSSVLRLGTL